MSVLLIFNNVGARLVTRDPEARAIVADLLSFDVEGAEYSQAYKSDFWDGRRTFLRGDGTFEAGFVPMVRTALRERSIPVSVQDLRPPLKVSPGGFELPGLEPRDWQRELCARFVAMERGVAKVGTGGGKTLAAAMIIKGLGVPTLFLTHKIDLVRQTAERFREVLGAAAVGVIAEGEWRPAAVTVASVQTIASHWAPWWRVAGAGRARPGLLRAEPMQKTLQAESDLKALQAARGAGFERLDGCTLVRDDSARVDAFLASIQLLIPDEAHRVAGDTFFRICAACANARFRLGLTATPHMRSSKEDNLRLVAACGEMICNVTNADLIEAGVIARPRFTFLESPRPKAVRKGSGWEIAYRHGVVRNYLRNCMAIEWMEARREHRPIGLVVQEEHGRLLAELAARAGLEMPFISGTTRGKGGKAAVRRRWLDALRDGEVDGLFASTIFDEGLDEPSIGAIAMIGGMKSKIAVFQRTGRAGRLKTDGRRQESFILDFVDAFNDHLMRHSAERYATVEREEGWEIDEIRRVEKAREAALARRFSLAPDEIAGGLEQERKMPSLGKVPKPRQIRK